MGNGMSIDVDSAVAGVPDTEPETRPHSSTSPSAAGSR